MKDINVCTFTGKLIVEPEMRYTPSGLAILRMVIAVRDDKFNAETSEWTNHSNVVEFTFFGKYAESIAKRASFKDEVAVNGRLNIEEYQKDGEKRKSFRFVGSDCAVIKKFAATNATADATEEVEQQEAADDDLPPWQ